MIRKLTLGLSVILSAFSANSLANNTPVDVKVPAYNSGGFTFGLAGLYLRPSAGDLDYGLVFPITATGDFGPGSVKNIDPDYDWGYRVNVGYAFPCTGNDVSLTYTHFKQDDTSKVNLVNGEMFVGSVTQFVYPASNITTANSDAKAEFKYQALDLDFGQQVNVGCNTHLRFLGGLRFADLDHNFGTHYAGTYQLNPSAPLDSVDVSISQKSRFNGIGPRFGVNAEYSLGNGFGIVGQATSALLVGDLKSSYSEHGVVKQGNTPTSEENVYFSNGGKDTRVVPNLTAKLGLAYGYQFSNPARTGLAVEAGYQVDHYFNAVDRLSADAMFNGLGSKQTIDASFNGPYVGIQVRL